MFVHSSQQREERTKKRRRGYRAFGFVATVAVGVCGTRFARTVLALFPPSFLRLHRPIKAGILLVLLLVFLTPSPFGHSPYIPCRNTGGEVEMYSSFAFAPILYRIPRHAAGYGRGRGGLPLSLPLPVLFNPPVTTCHLLYILLGKTPRNATGHGRGGGEYPTKLRRDKTVQSDTFNPLPLLIADEIGGVPEGRGG